MQPPSFQNTPSGPLKDYLALMTSTNIPGLESIYQSHDPEAVIIGMWSIFLTCTRR